MRHSIALTSEAHEKLRQHLIRDDRQEDLCCALWHPSRGTERTSALIHEVILPREGERHVHGNASVTGEYLSRVTSLAIQKNAGIVFMHSHLTPGWQGMSRDDIQTEQDIARSAHAATSLPLVGMTIGTDGAWSGRFWIKTAPKTYERTWCESVRVVGAHGLGVTFNDRILPPPKIREELKRTVSAWGERAQQELARLTIGVIGLGSVGSMAAESLARMGMQHIKLIDYDRVELHNLDRLVHATRRDAKRRRLKIDVVGAALQKHATAARIRIDRQAFGVTEDQGFRRALDCDLLLSCVDRPWPRHVLNYIAFAYLVPVIDGGILIRTKSDKMRHASWRTHAIYPGKRCLMCIGQYDPSYVSVERRGDLDDPSYIERLPDEHPLKRNENVFSFSTHLASSQIMHMLRLVIRPSGISDVGEQIYHFPDSTLDTVCDAQCEASCHFPSFMAQGDTVGLAVTGTDSAAIKSRSSTRSHWRNVFGKH